MRKLEPIPEPALLTVRQVAAMLGLCVRSVWKLSAAEKLPRPIRLTPDCPRWRRTELIAHVEKLAANRD